MSAVYSGGVRATAIAAITAAINARIVVLPDGTKDLDRESLAAWLRAEYDSMIPTEAPTTSAAHIASIDCKALVMALSNAIQKENFMGRPDWPNANTALTGPALVASVRESLAELQRLSADITAFYKNTPDKIVKLITGYIELNVEGSIPQGVQRDVNDRAYIVAYVTDRGEISAPSPASVVIQTDQNDTVTLVIPAAPAGRNITHFRPYRATSGNAGAAYLLVPHATDTAGWPIATLSILDNIPDSKLQEPCPSLTWAEPPADFRGLKGGGNGAQAGFSGNTFVPCVNNRPYAYPQALRKTTDTPIVGLGYFGQTWTVLTRGQPYYASGADTSLLDFQPTGSTQACESADSIVSREGGVLYASPDGICEASASGIKVITDETGFNLFTTEEWRALRPSSIIAAERDGCYIFTWNNGVTSGAYSLHLASGKLTSLSIVASAFYRDLVTDQLYASTGTAINALFTGATRRMAKWRGKLAGLGGFSSFGWLRIKDDQNKTFASPVTVRLYHGTTLHDTRVVTTDTPVRVISGRTNSIAVEIESASKVTRLTLASSTEELKDG